MSRTTRPWTRHFHNDFDMDSPEFNEHYDEIVQDAPQLVARPRVQAAQRFVQQKHLRIV